MPTTVNIAPNYTRFVIGLIEIDPEREDATYECFPGKPVHTFIRLEQPKVFLQNQQAHARAIACALIEVPVPAEGPPEKISRRFIAVAFGDLVDYPGELRYFATFVNPQNGAARVLYEAISTDEAEMARRIAAHEEAAKREAEGGQL